MSATAHAHVDDHGHDDHGHHHKETFVTKYIFSQDHKMIAKQYFIMGVLVMGFIGIAMSLLFRMQLAWPGESFPVFEALLGKWAPGGVMDADVYLALVTMHGTIMVFFVLTQGLSGTFSNLLIPLQIGARDMASGFLNMVSFWMFFVSSSRTCRSWLDNLSSIKCAANGATRFWYGYDIVVGVYGNIYCVFSYWFIELYCNRN